MTNEPGSLAKRPDKKGVTLGWRGIVLIIIAVILLVFAVQNLQTAPVNFLGATVDVWVWLLVIASFILGMLLGGTVRAGARKLRKRKPAKP
ncbi:MAG: hypothetical protein ACO3YU_08870 [Candidatus Nanopelagicales bacterium]|jgi:uncharacterized integral membrane protein